MKKITSKLEESNKMKKEIIEITEEVKIPGTNVILEKGDKIKILKEIWSNVAIDAAHDYADRLGGAMEALNFVLMTLDDEGFVRVRSAVDKYRG